MPALILAAVAGKRVKISLEITIQAEPGDHIFDLVLLASCISHIPVLAFKNVAGCGENSAKSVAVQAPVSLQVSEHDTDTKRKPRPALVITATDMSVGIATVVAIEAEACRSILPIFSMELRRCLFGREREKKRKQQDACSLSGHDHFFFLFIARKYSEIIRMERSGKSGASEARRELRDRARAKRQSSCGRRVDPTSARRPGLSRLAAVAVPDAERALIRGAGKALLSPMHARTPARRPWWCTWGSRAPTAASLVIAPRLREHGTVPQHAATGALSLGGRGHAAPRIPPRRAPTPACPKIGRAGARSLPKRPERSERSVCEWGASVAEQTWERRGRERQGGTNLGTAGGAAGGERTWEQRGKGATVRLVG